MVIADIIKSSPLSMKQKYEFSFENCHKSFLKHSKFEIYHLNSEIY